MVYESVFRQLPYPLALVDAELTIRDATAAFAETFGSTVGRLVGTPLELEPGNDGLVSAARPFDGVVALEPGLEVAVSLRPVEGHEGALALVTVGTPGDPRMAELVRSLRSLKHEMNNPLTGALGNINLLLRRGDLDERARHRLTTAEQEIKKVSLLVMRLSELAPFSETK